MEDDIFTKVIETVRGVPSEYDSTVENITGKILSQNNLKHAEIHDRFVDEWNHSESPKDSIVIAWLLSDRFLGTGEPAVRTVFADRLLERIDPEDNRLNPERLQEWIRSVIFSDEESIETLRNALIASKQIPKTTSSGGKAGDTEHSLPLFMKQWAYIFGVSANKMRELRKGNQYHFRKVSPRKWILPKGELPAEYLEKFRSVIPKSQPKKQ